MPYKADHSFSEKDWLPLWLHGLAEGLMSALQLPELWLLPPSPVPMALPPCPAQSAMTPKL